MILRFRPPYHPIREPIRLWLKDRGIYNDKYEFGYDMVGRFEEGIELAMVLTIDDGVLSDVDVTEFTLRFGG